MLVVFDIDEDVLRPEAANILAEREALWVFCKTYRVLTGWTIEGDTPNMTTITAPPLEPPVKLVPPPTKRTTAKKKLQNGPISEG